MVHIHYFVNMPHILRIPSGLVLNLIILFVQLCITLNNIEHVRLYMDELSELLEWDHVAEAISLAHEDPQVGKQALRTWNRLIRTAHEDVLMKSQLLLQQITAKMNVDIARFMEIFTVISPEKAGVSKDQINLTVMNV